MRRYTDVEVGGKTLRVSNLEKVLYPKAGFTKGQVIDYYVRISRWLLPHLKDRPLTLKRYPNGVEAGHFYEKECPSHRPEWVETASISRTMRPGDTIEYCLANSLPTLVWAANLADIELHTTLATCKNPDRPTWMVFDLDPGAPANILQCIRVGFWLKDIFDDVKLKSFPKTSGSKGLQIYVPLNRAVTYDEAEGFSRACAEQLKTEHPDLVVSKMDKRLRAGKVFVDWSQNQRHKSTVAVYSLRAKEAPSVSTPVPWQELERADKAGKAEKLFFGPEEVLKRVEEFGDLFEPVLKMKQKVPSGVLTAK